MRRKLDLGASLVGAPRLLLLDEPTTGLDPRSRIELWDAIRALVDRGTDVLLTTQYLDEADHLASRIVIIDHGRVGRRRHAGRAQAAGRAQRDRGPRPRPRRRRRRRGRRSPALGDGEPQIDEPTRRVSVGVGRRHRPLARRARCLDAAGRRGRRHRAAAADARRGVPGAHRPAARPSSRHRASAADEPERGGDRPWQPPSADATRHRPGCRRARSSIAAAVRAEVPADPAARRARHDPGRDVPADLPLRVRRRDRASAGSTTSTSWCRGSSPPACCSPAWARPPAIAEDLEQGFVDRLRSLPIPRSAVLTGPASQRRRG